VVEQAPKSGWTNLGGGSCESIEEKSGIPFGGLRAWPPGKFRSLEALRSLF